MTNKITQVIDVDTKAGVKNVDNLTDALGDTENKAKSVAAMLHAKADEIEADFKNSVAAADLLAQALGLDLAAKIGQNGIDAYVGKLKGLGLTADDIKGNVDDLAGALKHADDVADQMNAPRQQLDDVGTAASGAKGKLHDMNDEADNSRSVLANAVGNSVQDLSNLGGVAGTAGMALGQLGEYATEGEISLSGLAKVAGPLGAVAVVGQLISTRMAEIAAKNAFKAERVEAFTKALRDGKTAIDAYNDALNDDGKIEFFDAADQKSKDLTATLAKSHITWDTFISKVNLGKDGFKDWVIANGEAIGAGNDLNAIIQAGTQYIDVRAASEKAWADQQEVSGQNAAETDRETRKLNATYEDGVDSINHNKDATHNATIAVDTFKESVAGVNQKYDELTGRLDEQDAWENVVTKIGEAGDAAKLTGQDARDLTRDIADYVTKTETIPAEKKTEILTLLNEGDIVGAEQTLADLTRTREIYLKLTGPGAVTAAGYGVGPHAKGGDIPMSEGLSLVGEEGPELISAPGAHVYTAGQTAAMMGGGGSAPINVTINMPVGSNGDDVVRAIRKWEKRNGSGWRS